MQASGTWNQWEERFEVALSAAKRLGGDIRPLQVDRPASADEVAAVERKLMRQLPLSFRSVLLTFSRHVELNWYLPSELKLPIPFQEIFSGECSWNLAALEELEERRQGWVNSVLPDMTDLYDPVWDRKLAFLAVDNGDMLALDLSVDDGPVVYLSHDDGEGHGYLLGTNFIDFIERWSLIGCPGPEDWQMLPFTSGPSSYLEPTTPVASTWREIFGLELPV